MKFTNLEIRSWRQFSDVKIDLTKQVTILTGHNGSGKTSILNILSKHFGWNLSFVSTPYISKRKAKRLWSDVYSFNESRLEEDQNLRLDVGSITYSNANVCQLFTNALVSAQYQLEYDGLMHVEGIHIPSHRPVTTYNSIKTIPTDPTAATKQYQTFQSLLFQVYGGAKTDNPGKVQKESIISLALFGEGNSSVQPNLEMKRVYEGFQDVLKKVMPPTIGFQRLEVRMPEVVLVTNSGTFSLDAMSGGITAIFSIAWQIYMFGYEKENFVITIDEPENHLHPTMQRTFLPSLAKAFPNCNIIVATHSPFVVTSFPDANIYGLFADEQRRIYSKLLDMNEVSGTPNEVLREILDVSSNLPVWVEDKVNNLVQESAHLPPAQRARHIMEQLESLGIANSIVEYNRGGTNA